MDQNIPIRRNTFVLVAVLLFNFIWLLLLFWSCQVNKENNPTPTPEAQVIYQQKRMVAEVIHQCSIINLETRFGFKEKKPVKIFLDYSVNREFLSLGDNSNEFAFKWRSHPDHFTS